MVICSPSAELGPVTKLQRHPKGKQHLNNHSSDGPSHHLISHNMDPNTPECKELASPGIFQTVLSVYRSSNPFSRPSQRLTRPNRLIVLGILVSYLPQHVRIIIRRSSFGISPYFVLLGTTSATSAFANILVYHKTARAVACCSQIDGIACFAGLLGIFQVGTQWLCFVTMSV